MRLHELGEIDSRYRHIYIAPHFDDAVLSCGGAIARYTADEQPVLVLTVCGGSPPAEISEFAQQLHQRWGLHGDVAELRQHEDLAAMSHIGADVFWLTEQDALYRHPAYHTRAMLFSPPAAGDELPTRLRQTLQQVIQRAPNAVFYFPLGVGHHVDHQIAYGVGSAFGDEGVNVAFYEDLPYAIVVGSVPARLKATEELMPSLLNITDCFQRKISAITEYKSQLGELFGGPAQMVHQMTSYAASLTGNPLEYAERLWLRPATQ